VSDQRPRAVVLSSTSVDGRVSLGPGRIWTDDLEDPRRGRPAAGPGASEAWEEAKAYILRTWQPRAEWQGTGSFVRDGEPPRPLPPWERDSALYTDYMPAALASKASTLNWLVVTDGRGRLRGGYTGTERHNHHMLHLTSRAAPAEYLAFLRQHKIPCWIVGERRVDLPLALRRLREELQVISLLSEAGARLNGALLRAGLVDELHPILRPDLIGGTATPTLFDGPDLAPNAWPTPLRLRAATVRAGGTLWLRYTVDRCADGACARGEQAGGE
jgi:2,5-diamino-6-(ribosylamino)-4(3H)-pyrimidinone 5'-phosphate reductase